MLSSAISGRPAAGHTKPVGVLGTISARHASDLEQV